MADAACGGGADQHVLQRFAAGVGHEFFADCVAAVEAAARAPHAEHLSVSALHLLQSVARRLAASGPEARAESPAAARLPSPGVPPHAACRHAKAGLARQTACLTP